MGHHSIRPLDFSDFAMATRLLTGWTLWSVLQTVAIVVGFRWLAGGLELRNSPGVYLGLILLAAIAGTAGFFLVRPLDRARRFTPWMCGGLVPLLMLGLTLQPESVGFTTAVLATTLLAMLSCMAVGPELADFCRRAFVRIQRTIRSVADVTPQSLAHSPKQSLIRQRRGDLDELRGRCLLEFSAGQRVAQLHVPFCPPFANVPELECDLTDIMAIPRVKIAALYPHGMRLEARRTETIEDAALIPVDFVARLSPAVSKP